MIESVMQEETNHSLRELHTLLGLYEHNLLVPQYDKTPFHLSLTLSINLSPPLHVLFV
jgi:hypothetical protein